MRGTPDYDRTLYPFRVDSTSGYSFNVIDQRTQQMVLKGDAGTNPAPAIDYAKAQNEAYWAKVDSGALQIT